MMSRSLTLVACLALAGACEKEEHDTDGSTSDGGSATNATNATNATSATEGGSSPTEGSSASSAASGDSNDTSGQTCEGDWTLGSVPFSGDPTLGQACDDPVVPKNCADGTYIKFADTNECICIALCSSLGVSVGQNCTDSGQWVCAKIEATNASMNSATACVNVAWNVCTAGSGGTGGSSGGSASASGGDSASASGGDSASASGGDSSTGDSCAPSGAPCSFSSDCCSDDCSFDVCA